MQIGFDKYIEDFKKKWRFLPEIMGEFLGKISKYDRKILIDETNP